MPVFDGYRAFAIFGIVALHLIGIAPVPEGIVYGVGHLKTATLAQLVDMLFIVSGFVVFLPTASRGEFGDVGKYAIRRAARLLPAFYLILILAYAIIRYNVTPESIAVHAIGFQTILSYFPGHGGIGFGVIAPVWTLTVEISFYIVLPFVAMAFYRRPRAGLLVAAIVTLIWIQASFHAGFLADLFGLNESTAWADRVRAASGTQLPFWAYSFALGMIGARIYVAVREKWPQDLIDRRAPRLLLAGLVALILCSVLIYFSPQPADNTTLLFRVRSSPLVAIGYSTSLAVFMVALAFCSHRLQWFFANRGIRWLAEISYGVYLSHAVIMYAAVWFWGFGFPVDFREFMNYALFVVVASIAYGYFTARYFEQPIRRYAQRFGRRA
ncbi:MAG: acyltransferase [Thermoleophilia bacterium]|nr:acyltransferase [Thermoleophilia bacterium]